MEELENLKKTILSEYPRLNKDDTFRFECGPHLECFNNCCRDVNIFLTPYDVLRMRKAIRMESTRFLAEHTLVPFDKNQKLPVPLLKMQDTGEKRCPFVDTETGCTIYNNRPWPCRIYPLGSASPGEKAGPDSEPFYFVLKEDFCKGHLKEKSWKVGEWVDDQGINEYAEFGELFKNITLHPSFATGKELNAKQIDMYWTALYDLDKFRRFVFESSFLNRFDISDDEIAKLKSDDEELLKFGFKWIHMALFGEKSIPVKPDAIEQVKQKIKDK